jgi:hypothetical protein
MSTEKAQFDDFLLLVSLGADTPYVMHCYYMFRPIAAIIRYKGPSIYYTSLH